MKTEEYLTERYQSQSVQNPENITKSMASTASAPTVISRVRIRRDGRPTLIRGPVGPEPRSGIWKAKVRTSKFAVVWSRPGDTRTH
ncbi:conjugal transfer protein TraA [Streptomyces sp. NBRC 110611]|nr:conjugal transfer protein TraA [Streptomyces sp. NBRC 110611]